MRAVTDRYSFHPISGSLCGNTNDFTSPLGIRCLAGVPPDANPTYPELPPQMQTPSIAPDQ